MTDRRSQLLPRRQFLAAATAAGAATSLATHATAQEAGPAVVQPPADKSLLLSCKMGMIARERNGKKLSLIERLSMAKQAGFDGVDFDEAGNYQPEEVRAAVAESGVFVHNAINHAHWKDRLTSEDAAVRARGRANIAHCLRVSHAAGGSGVLIVVGRGSDGPADVIAQRCANEIRQLIPLAAALGQHILIENVWNQMFYQHDGPADQSPQQFIDFVDGFHSPWVGLYYDLGNHWKYGQPGEWLRAFGPRCVKLDVKGFSRKDNRFTDIGEGDLPWDDVRKGLADIGFCGWATAEVKGGDVGRLTKVRKQMQSVFGLEG